MELKELIGLGLAVLTGLGITKIWPIISNWVTHKSEERKLKMKLHSNGKSEVADIWKQQYEEYKAELKVTNEQKSGLEIKVATLEIKISTLKERLHRSVKKHGSVLSVKPRDNEKDN